MIEGIPSKDKGAADVSKRLGPGAAGRINAPILVVPGGETGATQGVSEC